MGITLFLANPFHLHKVSGLKKPPKKWLYRDVKVAVAITKMDLVISC